MFHLIKQVYSILTTKERRKLILLLFLMVGLAGMELVGVGSIFYYIDLLAHQDTVESHAVFGEIYRYFGFTELRYFFLALGGVVFLIMVVRGILSALNLYARARFTMHLRNRLASSVLASYVYAPYEKTLSRHSAVLSKNILVEVGNVVSCTAQTLLLTTEIIVAVVLTATMFLVEPELTIGIAGVLGTLLVIIIVKTRKRISSIGKQVEACNAGMYKSAAHALQGMKEIKAYRVERAFKKAFDIPLYLSSRLAVHYELLSGFPGVIVNLIAFGMLLFVLLYLIFTKGSLVEALPLIAAIGVALQRLLPSVYKIYSAVGLIRKYEPAIKIVKGVVEEGKRNVVREDSELAPLRLERELELRKVQYAYPGAEKNALEDVSLKIKKLSCVGIVGSSGVGKSTLVDVLLGLLPPSGGEILCDGKMLEDDEKEAFQRMVGYVPQQTYLLDDSLAANIAFGVSEKNIDRERVREVLKLAQLEDHVRSLPEGMDTMVGERGAKFSGGQRQRIGIARALYRDPEIIVMDEATNALDLETEQEFLESMKSLLGKKTLIIIAHRLSSLNICDTFVVLKAGRVDMVGTLEDVRNKQEGEGGLQLFS